MYIDYVRVYQRSDVKDGVGCNPSSYPTTDYINKYVIYAFICYAFPYSCCCSHANAYNNPNLTTWDQAGYTFPRNSKYDGC